MTFTYATHDLPNNNRKSCRIIGGDDFKPLVTCDDPAFAEEIVTALNWWQAEKARRDEMKELVG